MANRTSHRRDDIVELAHTNGFTSVEELSERFSVTVSTIRRDLARLTTEGRLTRTFGGAMPRIAHAESSLPQRLGEAHAAKIAIGRWAASQVHPGDTVLLDAGSTVLALAESMRDASDVTVATISLSVLTELADREGVSVLSLGGTLRKMSQGFVGPFAEAALERITCDAVFLGTDGVSEDGSICEAAHEQTRLKEVMIRRAAKVYVLAHGAKVGAKPFHAWLRVPTPWTLVTDESAPEAVTRELRARGVTVVEVAADDMR